MYRFLRAPFSRRAWRELAYVWASLPLAVAGFVGVYWAFSPVLPPLVATTLWLARWWARPYRGLAGRLLHVDIAPPVPGPRLAELGPVGWVLAQLGDGPGWRAAGYVLLRLPYAIVMVGVGAGVWLAAVAGVGDPLLGLPYGRIGLATPPSWLAVPIGLVLLFAAPWVVHGLVRLDMYLMGRLLGRRGLRERVRDLERTRALAVDDAAATLRRIERDLHDGAQARLVALAMDLTMMRERLRQESPDLAATRALADAAHTHAKAAIGELRDLARGIHPPVLDRGLAEALQSLASRSPVPVVVAVDLLRRPAPAIETIAYFCASELVTNVARHSGARQATVEAAERDGALELRVSDDGAGGAAPGGRHRRLHRSAGAGRRRRDRTRPRGGKESLMATTQTLTSRRPGASTRLSLAIYLALMAYLVVVKLVLDLASVEEILPAQATAFSWPAIGFLALAGGCAVWLGPRAGLPDRWDPARRKWWLLPAVAGLAVGGLNLAFAASTGSARIMAEAADVPAINVPFPASIPFYSGGAIVVEAFYRLILITLPLWLIAVVILRGRGRAPVFWALALLTSAIEPAGVVGLLTGHPYLMLVMAVGGYGINLFEAWLFWRRGFLAPLVFRLAFYLVWHIVGGVVGF